MPNAPISPVAWYKSWCQIGTFTIPMLQGPTLNVNENFNAPGIIGNYWSFNYVPGLIQPTVDVNLVVRDVTTEALSLSFLNLFLSRTNDLAHDTTDITGGVVFYDGGDALQLTQARAESFTINTSKGELIGMSCRFNGTDVISASVPSTPAWSGANILNYAAVNFDAGSFKDVVYQFGLSYSNNSYPDMALNGTRGPSAWHAGMQSAGFNCRVQSKAPNVADDSAVSLIITGANVSRTFTLNKVQNQTRRSRQIQQPQTMRSFQYQCTGSTGQANPPLVVS